MTNEALQILKNRRSVRKFKTQQIPDDVLDAILEVGTYAPTANGCQSPTIVAVQKSEDLKTLNRLNGAVMGKPDATPYYGAPTVVLVLAEKKFGSGVVDGQSVTVNLLNAASAAGVASCWIARETEMFETAEGKALLKSWGLTGDYVGVTGIALGYLDGEAPVAAPRKADYIVKIK